MDIGYYVPTYIIVYCDDISQDLSKVKEQMEAEFQREKARLQKKNDCEISGLRQLTLDQIEDKKKV